MHDLSVILTLAGGLAVALVFGWATQRIGLSTIVGYILAGIVVGPYTPGFVADAQLASQMAEIGVILLMFGVGLHFHPGELLRVWRIAIPGAVGQSAVAALVGWLSARALGWTDGAGIVLGMALAVASTVVLMKMLLEQKRLASPDGHLAVGWLIVEDLLTVVALVMLPALAGDSGSPNSTLSAVSIAIAKAGVFAIIAWLIASRFVSPIMERIAQTRSTELFTLTVFVIALGVALLAAEVFHISVALGAFFAGLIVAQSRFGPQAAADMAPFRDVFSALFFVSVGMLFNPDVLSSNLGILLAALAIVLILKPLVALLIVFALGNNRRGGGTVAVGLAQIGEFSFILAAAGTSLKVLPPAGMDILVATAILSIAINPLLFRALRMVEQRNERGMRSASATGERTAFTPSKSSCTVVIAGAGELSRSLAQGLASARIDGSIISYDIDAANRLRELGLSVIFGDAARPEILRAAGIECASILVIADMPLPEKIRISVSAKEINPGIFILAVAQAHGERAWLQEVGALVVYDEPEEIARSLLRNIEANL